MKVNDIFNSNKQKQKMIFSDSNFKPYRKKPTISIYDMELNVEQKIASFNNQDAFEWFLRECLKIGEVGESE